MSAGAIVTPEKYKKDYRAVNLSNQKIYSKDFSGQDLSKLKMRNSLFYQCNFSNADLTETDCSGSEFFGSSFVDAICYRTNFADAKLAGADFRPKDCFGITLTMTCKTFDEMKVSPLWWLGLATFLTMMKPVKVGAKDEDLVDKLIGGVFGAERYVKLRALFSKREFGLVIGMGLALIGLLSGGGFA